MSSKSNVVESSPDSKQQVGRFINPWRAFNGVMTPLAVLSMPGLSPLAKLLYGLLMRYAGRAGECYPSLSALARDLATSERTVSRTLAELRNAGLIAQIRRGPGAPVLFRFLAHPSLVESMGKVPDTPDMAGQAVDPPNLAGEAALTRQIVQSDPPNLAGAIKEEKSQEESQVNIRSYGRPNTNQPPPHRGNWGKEISRASPNRDGYRGPSWDIGLNTTPQAPSPPPPEPPPAIAVTMPAGPAPAPAPEPPQAKRAGCVRCRGEGITSSANDGFAWCDCEAGMARRLTEPGWVDKANEPFRRYKSRAIQQPPPPTPRPRSRLSGASGMKPMGSEITTEFLERIQPVGGVS